MNFSPSGVFQAAVEAFFTSFLPAKAATTSPHDPSPNLEQTHVLRTNPNRGSMPTDRTTTAAARSSTRGKRENHISRWLDEHDRMASDPIEVSDESDHANSRASSSSQYVVEHIPTVKARKAVTKQKQHQLSPSLRDGSRLFGDRLRPDANAVPIPIPGARIEPMKVRGDGTNSVEANNKQTGPLRPVNTLYGPLAAKFVPGNLSHSNGDGPKREASPYFTPRLPRRKTTSLLQASKEEGPARKRRRLEASRERSMSKESPIVIDDDVEMGEQDELALSSGKDQVYSAAAKERLPRPSTHATSNTSVTAAARIEEFHAVENMMDSSKYPGRRPVQVFKTNDPYDDSLSSGESSEDELFTKTSKQRRLESKGEELPGITSRQIRNGISAAAEASKPLVGRVLTGISSSSPAKPANDEAESPDVLQVAGERLRNGGRSSQVPLHRASGSVLANTIIGPRDEPLGQMGRPKPKAAKGKTTRRGRQNFSLRQLRFGSLPRDFEYMVTIDEDHKTLSICPQSAILEDDMLKPISLRRVSNIQYGENDCTIVKLVMSRAEDAIDDKMHLELKSPKQVFDFVRKTQQLAGGSPTVETKERHVTSNPAFIYLSLIQLSRWLQSSMERHEPPKPRRKANPEPSEVRVFSNMSQSSPTPPVHPATSDISKSVRSRDRVTDRLEAPHPKARLKLNRLSSESPTIVAGKDRGTLNVVDSASANERHAQAPRKGTPPRMIGTFSTYFQPRATRSSAANHAASDHFDVGTVRSKDKFSQTDELGAPWRNPLVYPKTGKKRENVDFHDLERLDDDEFLNDNLIGFYLRYLEHYLEKEKPEVAKKVYFFNSYFFERLTQTQKGTKGINYAAVEKWTRTVDIFSRDFVVVPVNENLHWYVAIICNLPNLRRKLADDDEEDDEVESIATSETVPGTKSGRSGTREIPEDPAEEPDGETRSSFAGLSLGDEGDAPLASEQPPMVTSDIKPESSPKQKKCPGRRKSARRSLIKIDPNKPVVITLDSLGLSRTATRTALKDYIVEEGKAKRSLDLERGALEGVTAKGIPTQKNYSDCGLFLCAYMEKFVLNPYQFVHDILQRDMDDDKDWPMMSSHDLRSRLRNLIMELHRQQEGDKEVLPIPDVGRILLRRPLQPFPGQVPEPELEEAPSTRLNSLVDSADQEAASQVSDELTAAASVASRRTSSSELSQRTALKAAEDAVNRASPETSTRTAPQTPQTAIVISDDPPNSPGPRHMSSRFRSHAKLNNFVDGPEELDSNPQALAERLRRGRSSASAQAHMRSQSVSTDFMTSVESYARDSSPGNMPGGWANGEVPETQSQDHAADSNPEEENELGQEILNGI